MDSLEAAKVIIDRISRLEPEHIAKKIIGYIYFRGLSDHEMIRLALGPDTLIHSLIQKAKTARLLPPAMPALSPPISPTISPNPTYPHSPFPPVSPGPFPAQAGPFRRMDPSHWDPPLALDQPPMHHPSFKMIPYSGSGLEDLLTDGVHSGASNFPSDFYCNGPGFMRAGRNSPGPLDYPVKTCHYFSKGFCKNGSSCRYSHGEPFSDSCYPPMLCPNTYEVASAGGLDDHIFSPGSLEKLELEITELLKSRRGHPVSIASLPMMYYEKYGRNLQAEGYLTESQRQGKAGYSLTKLLARLKNSIRLIDRPHGQHAVVLAEDAHRYMDICGERNDPGPIVTGSRQIYLTFPAESTFTEEDVSNYFSTFGAVQDVRIPCQQKRMFGFVTFVSAETVRLILSKGNPHYVCGARVLVKPYREKSKFVEKKYMEKYDHPSYYHPHPVDINPELQTSRETSRTFQRQLREEHEHTVELETMRFSQLNLGSKCFPIQNRFGYSINELRIPQDHLKFPSAERFDSLFDALNSGNGNDESTRLPPNNYGEKESSPGLNLPESPFSSTVASSVSAVI